jgi:hypothetical protein
MKKTCSSLTIKQSRSGVKGNEKSWRNAVEQVKTERERSDDKKQLNGHQYPSVFVRCVLGIKLGPIRRGAGYFARP